ncbi:MAG: type II toxin-antitoxin system HicA family toxin [Candidatus Lindowbacteria bacterium]|nr:type II toxin-antitoxin system HicA family toxin [Candidatus Lindowbacteria bacterium]
MTRVPRSLTARKLIAALGKDGFILARTKGSHHLYVHSKGRRVTVSYHHSSDTFPIGTLKQMIDDIGLTEHDLKRLELLA